MIRVLAHLLKVIGNANGVGRGLVAGNAQPLDPQGLRVVEVIRLDHLLMSTPHPPQGRLIFMAPAKITSWRSYKLARANCPQDRSAGAILCPPPHLRLGSTSRSLFGWQVDELNLSFGQFQSDIPRLTKGRRLANLRVSLIPTTST